MSTTAIVTPYEPQEERIINEFAVQEEKAIAKHREEMRKNRLQCVKLSLGKLTRVALSKNSVTINTRSIELVKIAAESIGYKTKVSGHSMIQLVNTDGSLINISKTNSGKVSLSSPKHGLSLVWPIVRECTAIQVFNHKRSRGMNVKAHRTALGEITIEGRAENQKTVVTTNIRQDGIAVVDVTGVKGRHCQEIISGIAKAMNGNQIDTNRKNEFFMNVDEEGHIHV